MYQFCIAKRIYNGASGDAELFEDSCVVHVLRWVVAGQMITGSKDLPRKVDFALLLAVSTTRPVAMIIKCGQN